MTLYIILSAMLAVFVLACMFAAHANAMLRKENMKLAQTVFEQEGEIGKREREIQIIKDELHNATNGRLILVSASYAITDSDEIKYHTDLDMRKAVRSRLAHSIAYKIIKQIGDPDVTVGENGHKIHTYSFSVIKDEED